MRESELDYDVIVLGAGPAGATAGIFLARFNFEILLIDALPVSQRGLDIPTGRSSTPGKYHNVPGFPEGIDREQLKELILQQAQKAGCRTVLDNIESITQEHQYFTVHCKANQYTAGALFFALGVEDTGPEIPGIHNVMESSLYWSAQTNGKEAEGKVAAVLGYDDHAALEALRLREFSPAVFLLANGKPTQFSDEILILLEQMDIHILAKRIKTVQGQNGLMNGVILEDNQMIPIEILFSPSEPKHPRSEFARELGVHLDAEGFIHVNDRFETNVQHVYAVGDIAARGPDLVVTSYFEAMHAAWAFYEEHFEQRLHQLLTYPHAFTR